MSHQPKTIRKVCGRCELPFEIPNIRLSPARELLLVCFPCPHCLYSVCDPTGKSGRCRDCSIPFVMIDHHAKGRCKRCDMRARRSSTPRNGEQVR